MRVVLMLLVCSFLCTTTASAVTIGSRSGVTVRTLESEPETLHRHGRFTVRGDTIIGGAYVPAGEPAVTASPTARHLLAVNFTAKSLEYYRYTATGWQGVFGRAVVTPGAEVLNGGIERGWVEKIDTEPTWCPTRNIRRAYPDLPAGCLPFGHSDNAMGAVKLVINWKRSGWEVIRIHGTSGFPVDFSTVETFGCVRLLNADILRLVELLGPEALAERIEVVFH